MFSKLIKIRFGYFDPKTCMDYVIKLNDSQCALTDVSANTEALVAVVSYGELPLFVATFPCKEDLQYGAKAS